jgi:DNA-binding transcriptional ArsR family regulator
LSNSPDVDRCARLLSALAAPERLRIVQYLEGGPRNVSEIAAMLGTSLVNVSHHLHVLRDNGLLDSQKEGRFVYYSLCPGLLHREGRSGAQAWLDLGCCRLELHGAAETRPTSK